MTILAKIYADWSDEFYCEGFWIIEGQSIESIQEKLDHIIQQDPDEELYFGTNEYLLLGDMKSVLTFSYLEEHQADVLNRIFPNLTDVGFGTFPLGIIGKLK